MRLGDPARTPYPTGPMGGRRPLSNESPLWSIVLGALGLAAIGLVVALVVVARHGGGVTPDDGAAALAAASVASADAPSEAASAAANDADAGEPDDGGDDDASADDTDAAVEAEADAGRASTASVPVQHKSTKPQPKWHPKHRYRKSR